MKRYLCFAAAILLLVGLLTGCGKEEKEESKLEMIFEKGYSNMTEDDVIALLGAPDEIDEFGLRYKNDHAFGIDCLTSVCVTDNYTFAAMAVICANEENAVKTYEELIRTFTESYGAPTSVCESDSQEYTYFETYWALDAEGKAMEAGYTSAPVRSLKLRVKTGENPTLTLTLDLQ